MSYSTWNSYDKILKNITSVWISSIILILATLAVSVSSLDVNSVYVRFLQGYDNAVLVSEKDFGEFREKTDVYTRRRLHTIFPYSWRKGGSSYIVVDDALKDGEIKLGFATAKEYNSTLLTNIENGDNVDFDGTTLIMAAGGGKGY